MMAMATEEEWSDYESEGNSWRTKVTVLEEDAKDCGAQLTAERAKHMSVKRSLALTSPSPALGVWRACIPVALELPLALTSGTLLRRPRACIQGEARRRQETTETAKKEPPINTIIIFVEGVARLQDTVNRDLGDHVKLKVCLNLSSPRQRLLCQCAWTPR